MALSPATRLGPYEITAPAGSGGMGEVYRARDTRLNRTVALKVLPTHLSGNGELRQRLDREARAISSLQHPHICVLYDVGHQDGIDYLVMEYLEGETLAQRLERGFLPIEQVLKIASEIADALDKAHRQGVIHRDLKPGNIMLTKSGAKLMDFGLAKPASGVAGTNDVLTAMTGSPPLTTQGSIVGTFQYMAPEQIEGREADARCDVFSFGAVLYEMATGQPAFSGRTPASVFAAVLASEPKPIAQLQPLTPPAFERVVRICLAKDPEERWQSAHDLKLELKGIAESGEQPAVPATTALGRLRPSWLTAALALVFLGVGFIAAWRLLDSPAPLPLRAAVLPPPGHAFDEGDFAVSPDGSESYSGRRRARGRFGYGSWSRTRISRWPAPKAHISPSGLLTEDPSVSMSMVF